MTEAPAAVPSGPPRSAPPARRRRVLARPVAFARGTLRVLRDPVGLLFGAIFQNEMRIAGRRVWTYVARALYLVLLLVVCTIALAGGLESSTHAGSGVVARTQALQGVAAGVTMTVVWFQFVALHFLAPVMTGGSIVDERTKRTLPALLTTPLAPLQIVVGKLSSRLAQLVILALLPVPVLLAVRVFGGVPADAILVFACVTLASVFCAASAGVYASVHARRASTAAFSGLLITGGLLGLPPLTFVLVNGWLEEKFPGMTLDQVLGAWAPAWPMQLPIWSLIVTSPGAAMAALTAETMGGFAPVSGMRWLLLAGCGVSIAVGVLLLLVTSWRLRRLMAAEADAGALPRRRRWWRRKPTAADEQATDGQAPDPDAGRRTRVVSDHPVFWREIRQPFFRGKWAARIAIGLLVLGLLYAYWQDGLWALPFQVMATTIAFIILLASAALRSAEAVAGEREAQSWDLLLTTPLRPREIVLSKFAGAVRRQWFIAAALLVNLLCSIAAHGTHWVALPLLLPAVVAPVLMLCGTGVFFSFLFKKTGTAAIANLALALALWVGLPILLVLIQEMLFSFSDDWLDGIAEVVLGFNPIVVVVTGIQSLVSDAIIGGGGYDPPPAGARFTPLRDLTFETPMHSLGFGAYLARVLAAAGAQALIGAGALLWAILGFRRLTGRSS